MSLRDEQGPPLPRGKVEQPSFAEPWQAQAFAMAVGLHERGIFTWSEWAETLAGEIKRHPELDDGHHYYELWLSALERLVTAKGLVSGNERDARQDAWERAALATPHGEPIELSRASRTPDKARGANRREPGSSR